MIRAGLRAKTAAFAPAAGEHEFTHIHAAEQKIEDWKQRDNPEAQDSPHGFIQVVKGKPYPFAFKNPGHKQFNPFLREQALILEKGKSKL